MNIITTNGEIDYELMLEDISRQEYRWLKTLQGLDHVSKLYTIANQHLGAVKRMKQVCQQEVKASKVVRR